MHRRPFTCQQMVMLAVPFLLPASCSLVFKAAAARWGAKRGYLIGFSVYWLGWCLLLPLWVLGWQGLKRLFRPVPRRAGQPGLLNLALLAGPVIVPALTVLPAEIRRHPSPAVVIVSLLRSLVNGVAEEVLWRGTYQAVFTASVWWGTVYPSIGFGLWHLAPQLVFPFTGPGGPLGFASIAILMGLAFGRVAGQTGSIRWTAAAHVLNNLPPLAGRDFL